MKEKHPDGAIFFTTTACVIDSQIRLLFSPMHRYSKVLAAESHTYCAHVHEYS